MKIYIDPILGRVGGSSLLGVDCSTPTLGNACTSWASEGLTVRWLRGSRMRTVTGLYDECAAALQFPSYFGYNMAALHECLADLDWIEFSSLVIVLFDADEILIGDDLDSLVWGFINAYEGFATPVESGEYWDRPAKPFHVVLQVSVAGSLRWTSAQESICANSHGLTVSRGGGAFEWIHL